ncbi:MAG: Crp/Fnr family transcriptional regulator [Deltaproteobacteria bacterium]|nr:Crp/Fnr family transcriptional regulator [Deltaproteobacteria bacterium]
MTAADDALSWLRKVPVFAHAGDDALRRAALRSEVRHYPKEKQVVRAGAAQSHILVVAQGALHLYRKNREAQTQILIAVVHAPATFGDAELYAHAPWMVSARSVTDTVIVHVPNDAYDELVRADGHAAAALYRECCRRLLLAVQVMQVHGLQKARNKILRLLWDRSRVRDDGDKRRVAPLSQVELAAAIGVNRKTIARNLRQLEREGALRREGSEVELLLAEDERPWRPFPGKAKSADWKLPDDDDE